MSEGAGDWPEFWRNIVLNEDGSPNLEQIKKELTDYEQLLHSVPLVYSEVTGGRVSKPNTTAEAVIGEFIQYLEETVDEALREERETLRPGTPALTVDVEPDPDHEGELRLSVRLHSPDGAVIQTYGRRFVPEIPERESSAAERARGMARAAIRSISESGDVPQVGEPPHVTERREQRQRNHDDVVHAIADVILAEGEKLRVAA